MLGMFWKSLILWSFLWLSTGCTLQAELLGLNSVLPNSPELTTPNVTSDPSAKFIIPDCTSVTHVYLGSPPVPAEGSPGWIPCATGEVDVILTEGSNLIEFWYLPSGKNPTPVKSGEQTVLKDTLPPIIAVISPSLGTVLRPGDALTVQWSTIDASLTNSLAWIDYSCDNGLSWSPVTGPITNSGSYVWTAASENSAFCVIRVQVADGLGNQSQQISQNFQIDSSVVPVSIAFTPDFSGKIYPLGKSLTINYATSGEHLKSNSAIAEVTLDGGISWQRINEGLPLTGSFNYQLPQSGAFENVFFRVFAENIFSESGSGLSSSFKVNTYGPITLTTPEITHVALASFSLSSCSGISKVYLGNDPAPNLANTGWKPCAGSFSLPLTEGTNVVYGRYLSNDGEEFARGTFEITLDRVAPTLNISTPTVSQNLVGDDTIELTWSYSDNNPLAGNYAHVWISLDNKVTWSTLGAGVPITGPFNFLVPPEESSDVFIRVRAPDLAGNIGETVSGPYNIILDSSVPVVTVTDTLASAPRAAGSTLSFTYSTTGSFIPANSARIELSYDGGATYKLVATDQPLSGTFNHVSDNALESAKARFRVSVTNTIPKTGRGYTSSFIVDANPPVISSLLVNNGDSYARTPFVSINANISDVSAVNLAIEEIAAAGSCDSNPQGTTVWRSWSDSATGLLFELSPVDGLKKLCVWARDALGRTTPPVTRTITLETINIPAITEFTAVNDVSEDLSALAGDTIRINWTAIDVEGLHAQPLSISYTVDGNTWKDIITDQDITDIERITWLGAYPANPQSITDQYLNFKAPTSSFFRIRLRVRDRAGNTSMAATSNSFNTSNWSIYAGSKDTGDGGIGKSASIGQSSFNFFAIHPKTGDFYFVAPEGLRKIDIRTGLVSTVIKGVKDILSPDWGVDVISVDDPQFYFIPSSVYAIEFDSKGKLLFSYLFQFDNQTIDRGAIFELDLNTRVVKRLAGGGTSLAEGAGPLQTLLVASGFGLDESDSLYVTTHCAVATLTRNQPKKFIKFTRQADGTLSNGDVFLGNGCVFANPTPGTLAKTAPGTVYNWPSYLSISPIDNGKYIYINGYGFNMFKIINGYVRSVNFPNGNVSSPFVNYNPYSGKLYADGPLGAIYELTPSFAGDGGETSSLYLNNTWSSGCQEDNILRSSACGRAVYFKFNNQGAMFFSDGTMITQSTSNRIRYINREDRIQTLVGSMPLAGHGLDKLLVRGGIRSISYKRTTTNSHLFPPGLYFMDPYATVMGFIDPSTHLMSVRWGDQSFRDPAINTAGVTAIQPSTSVSLSVPYGGHNSNYLSFDNQGLPWLRAQHAVATVTSSGFIEYRQAPATTMTWSSTTLTTARTVGMWVEAGASNLTIIGKEAIFFGGHYSIGDTTSTNRVALMDFTNNLITTLMDKLSPIANQAEPVPDGSFAKDSPLWWECRGRAVDGFCYNQYEPASGGLNNRLYFSEKNKLRYIDDVFNTATSRVRDLIVADPTDLITNFIFSDDKKMIFYMKNQELYCHNFAGAPAWCNDSNLYPFKQEMGPLRSCGNQLTWMSSTTLLISNCSGEILQYNLPLE